MSAHAYNKVFKQQNSKLLPATYKKGIISSVNITAFCANVTYAENPNNVIRGIPLASHIDPTKVMPGDRCRIDVFDETNTRDCVVAYIYGRNMT